MCGRIIKEQNLRYILYDTFLGEYKPDLEEFRFRD